MKKTYWFALLLSLPCLALECNPDKNEEEKPTYYMSEEFKDYVLFPEGSWWVYENQDGQIDSIQLFYQKVEIKGGKDDHPSKFEWVNENLFTSYYNDTIISWGGARHKGDGLPDIYFRGIKHLNIYPLFFSNKDTGYILKYNTKLKYLQEKEIISINDNTFKKVKIFKNLTQEYAREPEKIFYAKNVGIIKKVLFDSTVWELKDYHINN